MKVKILSLDERMHLFVSRFNGHRQEYEPALTVDKLKNQTWFSRMEEMLDEWEVPRFAF